jgi:hypothetical protein
MTFPQRQVAKGTFSVFNDEQLASFVLLYRLVLDHPREYEAAELANAQVNLDVIKEIQNQRLLRAEPVPLSRFCPAESKKYYVT